MVIAFLLAQLVLPGPLSGPIQPPGMICASGSCERGPMVYRTSASRSRLVVACDMRSDTCSDGRKITTTRATPVPCEVAPGVWEMVGPDEGCYSVRGLEAWAANTSYLAYGAELDHPAWSRHSGISVAARDGVWEIMRNRVSLGGVYQDIDLAPVEPEAWTASCVMKAGTTSAARLVAQRGAGWARIQLTENWNTYSVTNTVQPGQLPGLVVGPDEDQKSILVAGCWLTRTSTPGRPCWGGEAPVTCAADRHTISTEGWPTEAGEIAVTFSLRRTPGVFQTIINTRVGTGGNNEFVLEVSNSERLTVRGWGALQTSAVLAWPEKSYVAVVAWGPWGRRVKLDGVTVIESTEATVMGFGPTAVLGGSNANLTQQIDGSIRSLTVRNYEEVSP